MTTVFIGGSRRVSRFGAPIRARLDKIIENRLHVIVGDANGADKAVQQYLHSKHYEDVEVFCSGSACRNNIGQWSTQKIAADIHNRGRQFYAAKDRAMAHEATYGFMIWDGKSTGTLLNVLRLLRQEKKVVVYIVPERRFSELKAYDQWHTFLAACDASLRSETELEATLEDRAYGKHDQPQLPTLIPA
jgi:adenine-specific DNA-methyltransferase